MRIWFPPTGDCACYENASHRGDRLPGEPRGAATCRAWQASARPGASSERYASHRWVGGGTFHRRLAGHGFTRTRNGGGHPPVSCCHELPFLVSGPPSTPLI